MRWRPPVPGPRASISVATPRSIGGAGSTPASGAQVPPLLHGDGRPLPDDRRDVELIHQPSRAGETQTEPARGGVPVLQGAPDVRDARSLIARDHDQALAVAITDHVDGDLAAPRVHENVARELRDRGSDDRLVATGETGVRSQAPALLARG